MSDWPLIELGDVLKVQGGFAFKSIDWAETGVPVVKIKNVRHGVIDLVDCGFVTEEVARENSNYFIKSGNVLISMTGSGVNQPNSIVGRVARHTGRDDVFLINQRVGRFLIKNTSKIHENYLFYYLRPSSRQWEFVSIATGSANQVNISGKQIESLKINLPPFPEQKAISHILGTLDDKIELNRQMNQTLEAMAQALFKSWFVDFDPVIDNALAAGNRIPEALQTRAEKRNALTKSSPEGGVSAGRGGRLLDNNSALAALFPSSFEYNETLDKWIPEGWAVKSLGDITTELRRGISPKYIDDGGIRVLNQKCIRNHEIDFNLARRNDPEKKNVDGRLLEVGDMVVNSTGTGTLGRVANIISLEEPTVVDSHVTVLRANTDFILVKYFNALLFSLETTIEAMGEGSTGQTELSRLRLSELNVLLAPKEIQKYADKAFDNFFDKMESNRIQNQTLTQLRDTLLPQLISGKVRLPAEVIAKAGVPEDVIEKVN